MAKIDTAARFMDAKDAINELTETSKELYGTHAYAAGFFSSVLAQLATNLTSKQYDMLMSDLRVVNARLDEQVKNKKEYA